MSAIVQKCDHQTVTGLHELEVTTTPTRPLTPDLAASSPCPAVPPLLAPQPHAVRHFARWLQRSRCQSALSWKGFKTAPLLTPSDGLEKRPQRPLKWAAALTYRKVGGIKSGGSTRGRGSPDMAMSIKCMARMNSSAVSFPSWSMSERFLQNHDPKGDL